MAEPSETKHLSCPACDRKLSRLTVGSVTVDVCWKGCGGIWFDNFELDQVDEPHEKEGEALLHVEIEPSIEVDFSRRRKCPVCEDSKLMRHFFSDKRRVEVDHCPACGGYWLDEGELRKIRAEVAGDQAREKRKQQPYLNSVVIRYLYEAQSNWRVPIPQGEVGVHWRGKKMVKVAPLPGRDRT